MSISLLLENISFQSCWIMSILTSIGECQFSSLLETVCSPFYRRSSVLISTGECQLSVVLENVRSPSYWRMSVLSPVREMPGLSHTGDGDSYDSGHSSLLIQLSSPRIRSTISQLIPIKKYNSQIQITSSDSSTPLFNNWFFNPPEKHHSQFSVTALRVLQQGLELHCPGECQRVSRMFLIAADSAIIIMSPATIYSWYLEVVQ